jgi:hypothetical protein
VIRALNDTELRTDPSAYVCHGLDRQIRRNRARSSSELEVRVANSAAAARLAEWVSSWASKPCLGQHAGRRAPRSTDVAGARRPPDDESEEGLYASSHHRVDRLGTGTRRHLQLTGSSSSLPAADAADGGHPRPRHRLGSNVREAAYQARCAPGQRLLMCAAR